jgi:alginate O-acetyltransferase complex protein AlgI
LQIYFDFAGYTDIARGCARLLGYRFPPNFERPYLSLNISEFWRRWHISLSSWLRDYLYIPLGGNRHGKGRTYINYLIVMGMGGLWHGASWNFLFWGLYHGILLAIHRLWCDFGPVRLQAAFATKLGSGIAWFATIILVFIGWIPFRATDWASTIATLRGLMNSASYQFASIPLDLTALAVVSALYCVLDRRKRIEIWVETQMPNFRFAVASSFALWCMALLMQRDATIPFIYFQF